MSGNPWSLVLARLHHALDSEEYRRWFSDTHYATDSGDQITIWVPTEAARRHITAHFHGLLDEALRAIGRGDTDLRFVVTGVEEDEDERD
jgi:chromosomal replication initiation ATPase DnaA